MGELVRRNPPPSLPTVTHPSTLHSCPYVQAVASSGATERAQAMIQDAFKRPTWDPPGVESYNALLAGMVQSLKKGEQCAAVLYPPCLKFLALLVAASPFPLTY